MGTKDITDYFLSTWKREDDNPIDARQVLREAQEWQQEMKINYNILCREKRTKDVYEVLEAFGKDSQEVQNIRVKQLVRERIQAVEPEVKKIIEETKRDRPVPRSVRAEPILKNGVKLIPTPLPRVAFLSNRKASQGKIAVQTVKTSARPQTSRRSPEGAKKAVSLSQLLERKGKLPVLSNYSQRLLPLSQYFHLSTPASRKQTPAVPVVPSCDISKRNAVHKRERIAPVVPLPLKREDRIAVVNVESKQQKKNKSRLQVQVLPSVNIEVQALKSRKKANAKIIYFKSEDVKNGEEGHPSIPLEDNSTPPEVRTTPALSKIDSGTSPIHMIRTPDKKISSAVDGTTQTNGEQTYVTPVMKENLKHFVLQLVEEQLINRLKTVQISKHDEATETLQDVNDVPGTIVDKPKDIKSINTQTEAVTEYVDEETSYSEVDILKQVSDASVGTTVNTTSTEVQLDAIPRTSVALSPIQELQRNIFVTKEVEVKPDMVDCATSPVPVREEEGSHKSSDHLLPTPQIKKPFGRTLRTEETSSSSYLTDSTSTTTTTTTTTTTSDEQISEGEIIFKWPRKKVDPLPSLSEGEISPDILISGSRTDLNSSQTLSEGQIVGPYCSGPSQSMVLTGTSDADQSEVALQSTGELSIRPLSTEPSVSS